MRAFFITLSCLIFSLSALCVEIRESDCAQLMSYDLVCDAQIDTLGGSIGQTERGGVALVLSGGGAKGLYHVGIIKALEENQIPIDYVSGTSMGAIVGVLYAIGWSPERMWNFFLTDSVSHWLSGKIPDVYQGYYRRFDPTPQMVSINLLADTATKKNILQLPTNIIAPYLVDLAFIEMLAPASAAANNNFDSLMVPFRCVATDIYNDRAEVFRRGNLSQAVRASMSIPLVFNPIKKENSLLFDGGVLNNFPWQVLQEDFAPSNFIGGICTDNSKNPSATDVVGQVMSLVMRPTNYSLPDSTKDIYIKRRLADVGMLEYGRAAEVMQCGYQDAMEMMPQIKKVITRRVSQQQIDRKRAAFVDALPLLAFDSIYIVGLTIAQQKYVRRQLGLHLHNNFEFHYFYDKYLRLISAGVFTGEFPQVIYDNQTGFYRIELAMSTKPSIKFSLGGNISSSSLNEGYVAFNYRHTTSVSSAYGLQGYFGMFYNAAHFGGRHDFYTNFPFYIDYHLRVEGFDYDGLNQEPYYRNKDWRFKNQFTFALSSSISIPVLKTSAFRGRVSAGQNQYTYFESLHTAADKVSNTKFNFFSLDAQIETSSINYPLYGTDGAHQSFSLRYIVGAENFTPGTHALASLSTGVNRWWFELRFFREHYIPLAKWFSLGYLVDFTVSNHPEFSSTLASELTCPRFEPTPQTKTQFMTEFSSPSYLGLGLIPTFKFLKNGTLFLKTYLYAFVPQELVLQDNKWYGPKPERWEQLTEFIFGGSLVYQTPIGPVSFTVSKYSTGSKNWNFQFNFGYMLFSNRRF